MKKAIAVLMCLALVVCTFCACGDPTDFSDGEKLSKDYTRSTDPAESFNYNDGATPHLCHTTCMQARFQTLS